jgi:hypothetical protein
MRHLHYSSGYVLVGDRTCKALLRYARALADVGKSDIVMVPVVTEGGSAAYAHLLIGPASQLFSTPVDNSASEPVDDEVIAEMERLTLELQPSRPAWPQEMTDVPGDLDWEYDVEIPGGGLAAGNAESGGERWES